MDPLTVTKSDIFLVNICKGDGSDVKSDIFSLDTSSYSLDFDDIVIESFKDYSKIPLFLLIVEHGLRVAQYLMVEADITQKSIKYINICQVSAKSPWSSGYVRLSETVISSYPPNSGTPIFSYYCGIKSRLEELENLSKAAT